MAFKMKGFPYPGKSPLRYEKDPKEMVQRKSGPKNEKKTGIVYRDGKKYYKAPDGSLHTGQVSDYEMEKMQDEQGVGSGHNRKVMKDGPRNKAHGLKKGDTWTNPHAKKSDAQRRSEQAKQNYSMMTKEEKAKLQKEAAEKARKWRESDEYKRRRKEAAKKKGKKKVDTTQIDLLKKNNRHTKAN